MTSLMETITDDLAEIIHENVKQLDQKYAARVRELEARVATLEGKKRAKR